LKSNIKRHVLKMHGKVYSKEVKPRKIHGKLEIEEDKPRKCDKCESQFKTEQGLRIHVLVAHEEKQPNCFKCDQCGVEFEQSEILEKHVNLLHE